MGEKKKEAFSPPALGGSSLLVAFAVLALTVFALLSLSTVRADVRLGDAAAAAVKGYYEADVQAQEILARLRGGETPVEVTAHGEDSWHDPSMIPTQSPSPTPRSFRWRSWWTGRMGAGASCAGSRSRWASGSRIPA